MADSPIDALENERPAVDEAADTAVRKYVPTVPVENDAKASGARADEAATPSKRKASAESGRPSLPLVLGSAALAVLTVLGTVPATFSDAEAEPSAVFTTYLANPEVLDDSAPAAPAASQGDADPNMTVSAPAGSTAPNEGAEAEGEAIDAPPAAEPITSDGAGYATADSLLSAVGPSLFVALEAGADDAAMTTWVENALTFMPAGVPAGMAAAGQVPVNGLAATLTDAEAAELAAYVRDGVLQLKPGAAVGANDTAEVSARLKDLGCAATVDEAYRVKALSSDCPAGEEAKVDAQGLYESETPYLAVRCGDAWYFYAPSFTAR